MFLIPKKDRGLIAHRAAFKIGLASIFCYGNVPRFSGEVSRIKIMAKRPIALARSMYQAGASALPVA